MGTFPMDRNVLRSWYSTHQKRAGLFGVGPKEFNERVLARGTAKGWINGLTPEYWVKYAWAEVNEIAGGEHRCCPKQKPISCVCRASYICPDHGQTCIGSHD